GGVGYAVCVVLVFHPVEVLDVVGKSGGFEAMVGVGRGGRPVREGDGGQGDEKQTARSVWSAGYSPAFERPAPNQSGGIPRTPNASRPSKRQKCSQPPSN